MSFYPNYPQYGTGQRYAVYDQQMQTPIYNNYNAMQQRQQIQQIKCFPVSSYDEAKATMIDLDGSLFVFVDIANNCIYTKQVLLDGTAPIKIYRMEQQEDNQNNENKYVLVSDFNVIIKELTKQIEQLKGGCANVESTNATNNVENVTE